MKKGTVILVIIVLFLVGYYGFVKNNIKGQNLSEKSKMSFFITSTNPGNGANLGGLAGADAYCQMLAENVGITGKTWRAYLSTVTPKINAKDRIGDGPWYNAKGIIIAKNLGELHGENNINKITALTEKGEIVSGRGDIVNVHDILTGSNEDGTVKIGEVDTTCDDWTSGGGGSAWVGHHDRIGRDDSAPMKSWNSSHSSRGCDMESLKSTGGGGLFYCFALEE